MGDDDWECPLCMEEMDISDRNFKPCPCDYQICRFCWNHIKENLNGRCPACRREYSDSTVQFTPLTPAEIQRLRTDKKQKEKEKREMEANNRRHLANMRVVQKNLVYVIGLCPKLANEELLHQPDYFGQFGKILKIVINRKGGGSGLEGRGDQTVGAYVTFHRKEDATRCIHAIDGTVCQGKVLRAAFGTTKYCSYFLRGLMCQNGGCMYLHEPGDDADSYTKEEMALGKHHAKIHPNYPDGVAPTNLIHEHGGSSHGPPAPFGVHAASPPREGQSALTQEDGNQIKASAHGIQTAPVTVAAQATTASPLTTSKTSQEEAENGTGPSSSMSSPLLGSALPRTAAWANRPQSRLSKENTPDLISSQDMKTISCDLFTEIRMGAPALSPEAASREPTPKTINTSHLHRSLLLAQQAREYYLQLSAQLLSNMDGYGGSQRGSAFGTAAPAAGASPFLFDPFRDLDREEEARKDKSRFGFAQQAPSLQSRQEEALSDFTERFDRSLTMQAGGSPKPDFKMASTPGGGGPLFAGGAKSVQPSAFRREPQGQSMQYGLNASYPQGPGTEEYGQDHRLVHGMENSAQAGYIQPGNNNGYGSDYREMSAYPPSQVPMNSNQQKYFNRPMNNNQGNRFGGW